ncbi:TIGR03619 family F420-dependent LLM class oxidoreductase [Nonomuraea gerenzanensis]|uniref:Luciferase-like monooxygenase superfamily n=1 Tax=Nonomuraea gerenzanensis TaxID=93944 RepID=A0A1M4E2Z3_9ACTN|nr:TIGR03619 family F420-dependent LLM class oxidoreductase [Nonomuraea gerenzanensis]UBU15379.1 TIGR03619 family F420-dependent LLM class oxidoreductase [Nonomuraea gerenzanensis]SBO93130.1 Luciferase-like monooxygenase superfamily [Nonomuraea gerenzanensis]
MDLGIGLPVTGPQANPEEIVRVAQAAERAGLGAVWAYERLLRPAEPWMLGLEQVIPLPEESASVYDPLETLAYVAAATSTIKLGIDVIDALFHPPVVLARRLATLDRLSGGRLWAGLGQGWMKQEFEAVGVPVKRRGAGFAEHLEAMRACWGPDPVSFSGRFYSIPESGIGPKPAGLTLIGGAAAPAAVERVAALGMGLITVVFDWDQLGQGVEAYRKAGGQGPLVIQVNGTVSERPLDERAPLTGSPEQVAGDLARARALGADHVLWQPIGYDTDGLVERIAEIITY